MKALRNALTALGLGAGMVGYVMAGCGSDVESAPRGTTTGAGGNGSGAMGGMGGLAGEGPGLAGGTGGTGGQVPTTCALPSDRVDLLLTVDNSRGMGDKQAVLSASIPYLISRLTNPLCVNAAGLPTATQPTGPAEDCPVAGAIREFTPVLDLHLGVVSTSLGDHGGDVCPEAMPTVTNNDQGHLLSRSSPTGGGTVPTYQSLGFLAWDPSQQLSPPGETNAGTLGQRLTAMVDGLGEVGCGLESQLESWYRFLVDPNPYLSIEESGGKAVATGTDTVLLDQRKAFLRPDSLLVVIMLSDENDCSIRDGGQYFYAAKGQSSGGSAYHLPAPQITCATNPNDPCCRSCGQSDDGCPPKGAECANSLDPTSDSINLRCYDQKRRFGIDFLYPVDRYLEGLTQAYVTDRDGNLAANPVFSDLDPTDDIHTIRGPERVLFAGIVGVPWQDIARRTGGGSPDLLAGLDAHGAARGGFQSADELVSNGTWDLILGDPADYVDAQDPLMHESISPRSGTNPLTGQAIAAPSSGYLANPVNGHEYSIPNHDDLQYACIFPLPVSRDCSAQPMPLGCECANGSNDNPLCESPSGANGTTQYFAKAYPGRRELALVKALGGRGALGSICPAQQQTASSLDYAYEPAIAAIVENARRCL